MLKKWKTAAIVFAILFVGTAVVAITNHYYGWIQTIIDAFQPAAEAGLPLIG